jgi:hypothetical protein
MSFSLRKLNHTARDTFFRGKVSSKKAVTNEVTNKTHELQWDFLKHSRRKKNPQT